MIKKIEGFQGQYRFLSNFWPVEVIYDNLIYSSVEHAYQAAKTLETSARVEILHLPTPGQAKRYGKTVVLRPGWADLRLTVMRHLLNQKFRADPLQQQLLDTSDCELIEVNTWGDRYWGVCNGVGENHLGQLLMQLRESLQ